MQPSPHISYLYVPIVHDQTCNRCHFHYGNVVTITAGNSSSWIHYRMRLQNRWIYTNSSLHETKNTISYSLNYILFNIHSTSWSTTHTFISSGAWGQCSLQEFTAVWVNCLHLQVQACQTIMQWAWPSQGSFQGLLVGIGPILMQYHASFSTALILQLQWWHLQWLVSVQWVSYIHMSSDTLPVSHRWYFNRRICPASEWNWQE
jgi:hypothetical protein